MVSKASEDLPEPLSPVMTVRVSRGMSTSTFLRLCSRAPRTEIWVSIGLGRSSYVLQVNGDAEKVNAASRDRGADSAEGKVEIRVTPRDRRHASAAIGRARSKPAEGGEH